MNYLAHFHLAEQLAEITGADRTGLLIGALLGDFVKGPLRGEHPPEWETGIWLHRRIDALTDRHELVQNCLGGLPSPYRRFGGIMLDVCFDHCLAKDWAEFDRRELREFSQLCYQPLLLQERHYPPSARRQIGVLAKHDVLSAMDHWPTVERMLAGIGRRLRGDNPLDHCGSVLLERLPSFADHFREHSPPLRSQLAQELRQR